MVFATKAFATFQKNVGNASAPVATNAEASKEDNAALIDKQKQEKTHEFGLLRVSEMERMSVLPWSGLRFRFSLLGNQPSNI